MSKILKSFKKFRSINKNNHYMFPTYLSASSSDNLVGLFIYIKVQQNQNNDHKGKQYKCVFCHA